MRGTYIYDFGVQNKGESVLEHTVSYTYLGVTRSTTFMQGAFSSESFFIDLNNQWRLSPTVANPDSAIYEGVYESFSNRGIASVEAKMTIHLFGRSSFRFYIRSYGESSYDYVMVSQLDKDLNNSTSYTAADVKAHTRGKSTSGTSLSNYTLVEYTNISEGDHFITVVYIKDSSSDSGTDSGYVLIPKNQ